MEVQNVRTNICQIVFVSFCNLLELYSKFLFVVQQFSGVDAGSAFLFNPFHRKVWYNSPRGVVSGLYNVIGLETETVCAVLDENRKTTLIINLSLDSLGSEHDEIRGVKGNFECVIETYKRLETLRSTHPCLKLGFHIP